MNLFHVLKWFRIDFSTIRIQNAYFQPTLVSNISITMWKKSEKSSIQHLSAKCYFQSISYSPIFSFDGFSTHIDFPWLSPLIRLFHSITMTYTVKYQYPLVKSPFLVQTTFEMCFHSASSDDDDDDASCHWDFNRYSVLQAAYKIFDTWNIVESFYIMPMIRSQNVLCGESHNYFWANVNSNW